jgi:hypothetical protein
MDQNSPSLRWKDKTMMLESDVKSLYAKVFNKYLTAYLHVTTKKCPSNCVFNVKHPLDLVKLNEDGSRSVTYNKIGSVTVFVDSYNVIEDTLVFTHEDKTYEFPVRYVFEDCGGIVDCFHTYQHVAEEYEIPYDIKYIGLCKLSLDRETLKSSKIAGKYPILWNQNETELKLCEHDCDDCPAYLLKYSKDEVLSSFWDNARREHSDLMVLQTILDAPKTISVWTRIKCFFQFNWLRIRNF